MKILKNRRLWIIITIVAIVLVGVKLFANRKQEREIAATKDQVSKETTFVQATKQFALTVPAKWTVSEPISGKQTFIYPTGTNVSGNDIQTLMNQDVVVVETAQNKKESFEALINELKSNIEKNGSTVNIQAKDYGALKATKLTISGKVNYQQLFFDTSTVIILTAKNDHPIFEDLAKSLTIDLAGYADDIAQATTLTRQTNQNISAGKFSDIYKDTSDNLKKIKTEAEFSNLLKDVSADFSKNVLIWGIFITDKSIGTALNIVDQDKIIRRGSFYYVKEEDRYLLDSLRISTLIKTEQPATDTAPAAPTDTKK